MSGSRLGALAARGKPIVLERMVVRGDVRLPVVTEAAFVLRGSRVLGDLVAPYGSFHGIVDLSGTEVVGEADFSGARFDGAFLWQGRGSGAAGVRFDRAIFHETARFNGARLGRSATFSAAHFHAHADFVNARFAGRASFSLTAFDGPADFASALFRDTVTFRASEIRSVADFSSARFDAGAVFDDARFYGPAEFVGTVFLGARDERPGVSFLRARFDSAATFLNADLLREADFSLARASEDVDFEGVTFARPVSFSTVEFLGSARFASAHFERRVTFDQGLVRELDLRGALIDEEVRLPSAGGRGGIGALRLDFEDTRRIEEPAGGTRARQRALRLVEGSAREVDDLGTANQAKTERLSLAREGKSLPGKIVDWIYLGLFGYLVQPLYPLVWILGFLLIGAGARSWARGSGARSGHEVPREQGRGGTLGSGLARKQEEPKERAHDAPRDGTTSSGDRTGFFDHLMESLGSFLKLEPPTTSGWRQAEYVSFKFLTVVLLINAGNAWPVTRELLEGVL